MNLAFLVYFSRSGSTYLANQLALSSTDLVVLPETDVVTILMDYPPSTKRPLRSAEIEELLGLDELLASWDLPSDFAKRVADKCDGYGPIEILKCLAQSFAEATGRPFATHALFQRGNILNSYEQLARLGSDLKLICIYRDPRASISSLLQIAKAEFKQYDKRLMGRSDVIGLALRWQRYYDIANRVDQAHRGQALIISYEDLCRNRPETLETVLKHIQVSSKPASEMPFVISSKDQEIHPKINQSPDLNRLDAWKKELDPNEGRIIETILRRQLQRFGYSFYFTSVKAISFSAIRCWLRQGLLFLKNEVAIRWQRWQKANRAESVAKQIARMGDSK